MFERQIVCVFLKVKKSGKQVKKRGKLIEKIRKKVKKRGKLIEKNKKRGVN